MLSLTSGATSCCDSLSSALPFWRASSTPLVLIDAYGDEFPMKFAAVVTNLKSNLMRFYAKESVLNNGSLRPPSWRSSIEPRSEGEDFSGNCTVTRCNPLIHIGATTATKSGCFGPKWVQQSLLSRG